MSVTRNRLSYATLPVDRSGVVAAVGIRGTFDPNDGFVEIRPIVLPRRRLPRSWAGIESAAA